MALGLSVGQTKERTDTLLLFRRSGNSGLGSGRLCSIHLQNYGGTTLFHISAPKLNRQVVDFSSPLPCFAHCRPATAASPQPTTACCRSSAHHRLLAPLRRYFPHDRNGAARCRQPASTCFGFAHCRDAACRNRCQRLHIYPARLSSIPALLVSFSTTLQG